MRTRRHSPLWNGSRVAACIAAISCVSTLSEAQVAPASDDWARTASLEDVVRDTSAAIRRAPQPWITRGEAMAFGGAAVATVVLSPLDGPAFGEFDEPRWRDSRRVRHVAGDVAFLGSDGPFVASALLYLACPARADGLRQFAAHDMESIALATVITGVTKGITGRALPGVQARHKFQLGRGFHDDNGPFVSFPSGHTAAAFALAATISGEAARVDSVRAAFVEPIAFGLATAVGVARVVQRAHWPSDLPLGAVIGTWSGRAVQRHASQHGKLGALVRGLTIAPDGNGRAAVGWSSRAADDDR